MQNLKNNTLGTSWSIDTSKGSSTLYPK